MGGLPFLFNSPCAIELGPIYQEFEAKAQTQEERGAFHAGEQIPFSLREFRAS
jgi:hypothetical protein